MQKYLLTPHKQTPPITPSKINRLGTEELELLEKLGLTNRQARVYLALLKTNNRKAKTIADISQINRQEIYRLLDDLQQIGLIQKHLSIPTTYDATPITDTIKILLTQKTNELTTIKQKTKQITKKLQNYTPTPNQYTEHTCIGTIFEGDKGKKYHQAINTAYQTIDIITNWKRFKQLTTLFESQLQKALKNNLTLRILTEKPQNQPLPNWIINNQQTTKKHHQIQLKILPTTSPVIITIFDQKTATIPFHQNINLTKGPHLWTTNPMLIALSQTYFNNIWTTTNFKNQTPAK